MGAELNPATGSHPAIRFDQIPVVEGPLSHLESTRSQILKDVVDRTVQDFSAPYELLLSEVLFSEKARIRRSSKNLLTLSRRKSDLALLGRLQSGMFKSSVESNREELLRTVVDHYAEEIGGHFNSGIYRLATRLVPWGFSWLLNAASVKRFLPWGMTESLQSRVRVLGEIPMLQRLSSRGTILLVPTHQSNIDSVLIGYIIYLMQLPPFAYGAGLNLFSNPVLSFFMSRLGAYTVDRQKQNAVYKHSLKNYSTRILRQGVHSIFFPGGGRSRSGEIENHLKLGLLGTGLEAQIYNHIERKEKPSVFVVPMVMSYHFVLEAASLIEDYLVESGKHRFLVPHDESWQVTKIFNFFWKFFSNPSNVTIRIGKPLDIFGNLVDESGNSIGPNGTRVDPVRMLTTRGELRPDPQRDQEYTRELGVKLVKRYHQENTVLTSHVVAKVLFETLRRRYPSLDLFRFLRITAQQRVIPDSEFFLWAEKYHRVLTTHADRGDLFLSEELKTSDTQKWVMDGIHNLGVFHEASVVRMKDGAVWTEDMNLLYYYRNRLSGYEFLSWGPG